MRAPLPAHAILVALVLLSAAAGACAGRAKLTPRELCNDSDRGCNSAAECTWDETRQCTMCYCRERTGPDGPLAPPGTDVPAVPGKPGGIRPG